LFTSKPDQLTYQLTLASPQPVDLEERYPNSYAWLMNHMPEEWNERISFFGLMWLEAWLETTSAPESKQDWKVFFKKIEKWARKFAEHHPKRASDMVVWD
jgi:hypothetical protein